MRERIVVVQRLKDASSTLAKYLSFLQGQLSPRSFQGRARRQRVEHSIISLARRNVNRLHAGGGDAALNEIDHWGCWVGGCRVVVVRVDESECGGIWVSGACVEPLGAIQQRRELVTQDEGIFCATTDPETNQKKLSVCAKALHQKPPVTHGVERPD